MWREVRVGDIGTVITGATPKTSEGSFWGGDIPFISPADFSNSSQYVQNTEASLTVRGARVGREIPRHAILVTCIGSLGKMAISNYERASFNQQINAVVCSDNFNPYYLFHLLQHDVNKLVRLSGATTIQIVNKSLFETIKLMVPNRKVQDRIATVFEIADSAIEKTQALIAKYENIKQGMMQDLFTRGVDENGQLRPSYEEAPHLYQETELGWIPKDWEVASFLDLLDQKVISEVQDGNHGEQHPKSSEFVEDGVPFIMANDISKYGDIDFESCSRITEKQYRSLRIGFSKAGDVLLTHKGTIGRVSVVPNEVMELMLTPQVTYYRVSDKKRLSPHYLAYFLSSPLFQSILQGLSAQSTRAYIGITEQKKLKVAIPLEGEPTEQSNIVASLDAVSEKLKSERQALRDLKSLKSGLMQDLLTGKVRVAEDAEERKEAVA